MKNHLLNSCQAFKFACNTCGEKIYRNQKNHQCIPVLLRIAKEREKEIKTTKIDLDQYVEKCRVAERMLKLSKTEHAESVAKVKDLENQLAQMTKKNQMLSDENEYLQR